jgi:predicted HicB family RNase H-like nuclease
MKKGTQAIYLRVPQELKLQIEMEAARQGRSVNNLVSYIVAEYLKPKKDRE